MKHVEEHITAYIHGEYSEEQRRQISDHLIDCAGCQKNYKELMATHMLLASLKEIQPSAHFTQGVLRQAETMKLAETEVDWILEEMQEMDEHEGQASSNMPWYAISSCLIVLGMFFMLRYVNTPSPTPNSFIMMQQDFVNANTPVKDSPVAEPKALSEAELALLFEEWDMAIPFLKHEKEINKFEGPKRQEKIADEKFPSVYVEKVEDKKPKPLAHVQPKTPLFVKLEATITPPIESLPQVPVVYDGSKTKKLTFWLYPHVNKNGFVGKTQIRLNTLLSSLLLNRRKQSLMAKKSRYVDKPALASEIDLINTQLNDIYGYLKRSSKDRTLGNNVYQHVQFTYFFALLTNEGQNEYEAIAFKGAQFLLTQQNPDGGWSDKLRLTKNDSYMSSNSISSGWAVLALSEVSRFKKIKKLKIRKKISRSLSKSQAFFKRMRDPRTGECGYRSRGDKQDRALCTLMASMANLAIRSPKQLKRTMKFTRAWLKSGMKNQEKQLPAKIDYDFLWLASLFLNKVGDEDEWKKMSSDLIEKAKGNLPKSNRGKLPNLCRMLLLENLSK